MQRKYLQFDATEKLRLCMAVLPVEVLRKLRVNVPQRIKLETASLLVARKSIENLNENILKSNSNQVIDVSLG